MKKLRFYARNIKIKLFRSLCLRKLADIFLTSGPDHFPEAEYWTNQSIEKAVRGEEMITLAGNLAFSAEFLKRRGMTAEARKSLEEVILIYKACGADGWVEKYRKEMVALDSGAGLNSNKNGN